MSDSKLAETPQAPANNPSAAQTLQDFLVEKNMEIRLSPPTVRQVENGGLMIDQPNIIVNYKPETNSINKN